MKIRTLYKGIILVLGISLIFSSLIFAGPNENAGIVFDLNATTYGNQNLISIPSQPAGTYIRLDVYCTEVQNLDTYEFEIIYDPTELAYVAASATNPITYEPNILTTNGGTAIGWMIDTSTPGVLSIAYTLAGTDTLEAPEGEGLIADIVLQALTPSQYLLTFGDVHFYDSFGVMDIITNKGVAILSPYGSVDGTVTDANNGEPIEDALITATSQGKVEYTGFTNADGYYIIDILSASEIVGNYIVICDAGVPYTLGEVTDVEIIEDETTTIDFVLAAPVMVVDPLEIFPIVENMGDSTIIDITLSNIGTEPFDWRGSGIIVNPEQLREPLKIEFPTPPSSNYYAPIKVAPSLGFAPEIIHTNHSEPVVNLTRGSTGWAYDVSGEYFFSFDTDMPGTANIINNSPNWYAFAGDFDSSWDDDATYYIIKHPDNIFAWVDIETGIATDIGPIIGSGGSYLWTGISCDKSTGIMYAVESAVGNNNLYTIDLATGTPTLIGATGIPFVIEIAVDGEGIIWGYDIIDDNMYTIDPTTAVGTIVGPIGFDANYAQGMSWDPETDQVYLTAYNLTLGKGEFRVLDRETGYCAYVGPTPGSDEVCVLGFIGLPWITVEPTSGTIEPGGDEIVRATFYWLDEFFPGQIKYADIVFTPDPNCGKQTVSVQVTFGPDTLGSISGLVTLENTPYSSGNVEDVIITAVNQVFPSYYTAFPDSTGEYTIQGVYPGTYDVTATLENYEDATIEGVVVLENQNTPNIDFEMNCLLGALQGTVTDVWGVPIEGAELTVIGDLNPLGRYVVYTDSSGYYEINPIIGQFYNFTCEAEGFSTFTDTFTVLPGETYVENVIMCNPEIRVEPDSYEVTLAPETQTTRPITVYNDGNAPLSWNSYSSIEKLGVDLLTNRFEGVTAPSMNAEVEPNQTTPYNPTTKDMWDILFAYDVDTPSGLTGLVSAESDGNYLYTTKWATGSNQIAKFDLEGNFIEIFSISGVTCLRDLAYDGTYFYGSNASAHIWQMDFDTQTLVNTTLCPVAVRSIAYDEDNDAFWVNNWSEDLKLVDRSGNVLNTIYAPPSLYGTAYDNISTDGPYLWIFTGTVGGGCQIEQYDLNTLALTGKSHSVSGDFPGTIAGGLFISGDIVPGTWVLGGLAQGTPDILFGYELCPTISWLTIDPDHGIVEPGQSQPVTATFRSLDFPVGTVKTANIHFIPNVGEEDTVFAMLMVEPPEYGNLDGTVTDSSSTDPIEGVLITATSSGKQVYTDTTDVNGYYLIEDMLTGIYDVTFEKEGYNVGLEPGILIENELTTTVNYTMIAPELYFTPTNFEFEIVEGYLDTDTLYIENIGTGPVDFSIDIHYITENRQTILCVDRDGSSMTDYTDDWFYFQAALDSVGYTYTYYEVVDLANDGPDLATMMDYEVIIWFSGEVWGYYGHDCMTDNDEMNLGIYLQSGGTLFLSAQDYLWASYPSAGNFSAGQFPYDYLGMRTVTQDDWLIISPSTGSVEGVAGSLAEGYTFEVQDIYTTDKDGLIIDRLTDFVADDLFNLTSPTPEGICGIQYDAMTFRTVFTSVSFAAITNTTVQTNLIDDIIYWLSFAISPWLTVVPDAGTINPSTTAPLTVTANAEELEVGDYYATITVNTENPDIGQTIIDVHLEVTIHSVEEIHILSTKLNSNFPNPFSPDKIGTTISFSLKEKSNVKLSVYNIKGQLVEILINGMMNPVANYEIVWKGRNGSKQLSNGIYFYALTLNGKVEYVKKMILMR